MLQPTPALTLARTVGALLLLALASAGYKPATEGLWALAAGESGNPIPGDAANCRSPATDQDPLELAVLLASEVEDPERRFYAHYWILGGLLDAGRDDLVEAVVEGLVGLEPTLGPDLWEREGLDFLALRLTGRPLEIAQGQLEERRVEARAKTDERERLEALAYLATTLVDFGSPDLAVGVWDEIEEALLASKTYDLDPLLLNMVGEFAQAGEAERAGGVAMGIQDPAYRQWAGVYASASGRRPDMGPFRVLWPTLEMNRRKWNLLIMTASILEAGGHKTELREVLTHFEALIGEGENRGLLYVANHITLARLHHYSGGDQAERHYLDGVRKARVGGHTLESAYADILGLATLANELGRPESATGHLHWAWREAPSGHSQSVYPEAVAAGLAGRVGPLVISKLKEGLDPDLGLAYLAHTLVRTGRDPSLDEAGRACLLGEVMDATEGYLGATADREG